MPPLRRRPPGALVEASLLLLTHVVRQARQQSVIGEMLVCAEAALRKIGRLALREAIFAEQRDLLRQIGTQAASA